MGARVAPGTAGASILRAARRALVAVNRVIAPVDRLFRASGPQPAPPLFIIGAPRSGTTLTYQLVTQEFQAGYFTEIMNYLFGAPNLVLRVLQPFLGRPKPVFESRYGRISGLLAPAENGNFWFRWFPRDGVQGHYLAGGAIKPARYRDMVETVASLSVVLGHPLVFKNVYLTMTVGPLARIFPDARFLLVRRDPVLVIQSVLKARAARTGRETWWSVKPPGYRRLLAQPLWQQAVEQVKAVERIARRDLEAWAPGRFMELRYEDLCTDPRGALDSIQEWLAPLGYRRHARNRVPASFPVADRIHLSPELLKDIQDRLSTGEDRSG
ncbi:MAG: hypothetical protein B7Z66_07580 [Chromatiales bacterium 21-64-14]|nr:MAG: hypothetical protein B7Z66_07580 [Chromatiales bacterium 21-64-14]